MKVLVTLSYDGTSYNGYQLQGSMPTVALMLNNCAKKTFGFECNVTGCSRTDSGVHALGFCATIEPKDKENKITVPVDKIPIAMNVNLPDDISVLKAEEVPDNFHARYNVCKKEYIYKIHDSKIRNPFYRGRALEYGKEISDENIAKMDRAAKKFIGTYEFDAFMSAGSKIENTKRTVYDCGIVRKGDIVEFYVSADGFLYNMVRIMVGTLLMVENSKMSENDIISVILSKNRSMSGFTAKPDGLYLNKVFYNY